MAGGVVAGDGPLQLQADDQGAVVAARLDVGHRPRAGPRRRRRRRPRAGWRGRPRARHDRGGHAAELALAGEELAEGVADVDHVDVGGAYSGVLQGAPHDLLGEIGEVEALAGPVAGEVWSGNHPGPIRLPAYFRTTTNRVESANVSDVYVLDYVRTPGPRGPRRGPSPPSEPGRPRRRPPEGPGRQGLDPAAVDDVIVGSASQVDEQGGNLARVATLLAGWGDGVPGGTVNRFCASGSTPWPRRRRGSVPARWTSRSPGASRASPGWPCSATARPLDRPGDDRPDRLDPHGRGRRPERHHRRLDPRAARRVRRRDPREGRAGLGPGRPRQFGDPDDPRRRVGLRPRRADPARHLDGVAGRAPPAFADLGTGRRRAQGPPRGRRDRPPPHGGLLPRAGRRGGAARARHPARQGQDRRLGHRRRRPGDHADRRAGRDREGARQGRASPPPTSTSTSSPRPSRPSA